MNKNVGRNVANVFIIQLNSP